MSAPTLYEMPSSFRAGTTLTYTRTLGDYPASSWTLTVYLAGASVAHVTGVASGDDHVVTFSAATTAALTAGNYTWTERVTSGAEAYTAASGTVEVLPDLTAATAGSLQSHAEKTLAIIYSAIEGRLPAGMESYQIGGRAVKLYTVDQLMRLRGIYESLVYREKHPGNLGPQGQVYFGGS